jgi:hypothetical protein
VTTNFRLPSLQLGTAFDTPIVPLDVPGELSKGTDSALCIIDGANRAPRRLSRLVRPVGLLGVKLAEPRSAIRVTVRLLADDISTMMWDRHMFRLQGEPMPEEEEYVPSDVSTRHRLVEVTAQGRSRGLAMLALRHGDDGVVRQHVSFELQADEIGDSGLVMVGLEHPRHAPGWSLDHVLEDSLVGVCVARMMMDPLDERVKSHVLTGRPSVDHTPVVAANPGFFVVNPAADGGQVDLSIAVRGAGGERLQGRRAKVKHPVRYARELAQDRKAGSATPAAVEVVDLQGNTVLETTVPESGGRHDFTVPAGSGPVFVRARKVLDDEPTNVNWGVRIKRKKG